jgi:hypothetical protein
MIPLPWSRLILDMLTSVDTEALPSQPTAGARAESEGLYIE